MTQKQTTAHSQASVDDAEIARFASLAEKWWQPKGPFQALHAINVPRLTYVRDHLCGRYERDIRTAKPLAGVCVLDIGCGGGLIAEPLVRLGAEVTAIDAGADAIAAARLHAKKSGLTINYRHITAEKLAAEGEQFDCVLTLEVIEHVADLPSFLNACAALIHPGGSFFAATLNRTTASYLLAIVAAERILRWLPPGMHQWSKFVRPSELIAPLRQNNILIQDVSGISYDLFSNDWSLSRNLGVNYIAYGIKNSA